MSEMAQFAKEAGIDEEALNDLHEEEFANGEEEIELQDEIREEEEADQDEEEVFSNQFEEKAAKLGWKPKEQWNGEPEDWSSAKRFLQTRDIIEANKALRAEQDRMKSDFDARINNLQNFHEQALKKKIEALERKRDDAASEADMDTYNAAKDELKELEQSGDKTITNKPNISVDPAKVIERVAQHEVTQEFVRENPWLAENNAKGVYGQKLLVDWISNNVTDPNAKLETGLEYVKNAVEKEFKMSNPNRQRGASMGDRGNGPKRANSKNTLTMNDLTAEEIGIWNSMGKTWKNQEEFLQTVADSRKGG